MLLLYIILVDLNIPMLQNINFISFISILEFCLIDERKNKKKNVKKNILNPLGFEPRIQGFLKYFLNQGLACFRLQHGFIFFSDYIVRNRPNPYNKFKK